ncbi:methenyltetrahydromethanopterin cyclohydrolase [Stratiformator vulcanicus]|uniref:Methenyltetrahydromethanopterin cyclohydrolase n=1 Tax=Stratiformator vulcanicus TaxID=2527980 RepID=A0A517R370_9PLAN|nr:methenyltetrahydromethanopterin cyclohydrolase [Stratiformator vulcanicus]QDT38313.1 Methenyltetrahydromethanopterin cyclohydrolase [Stratiformator vulcanicus]
MPLSLNARAAAVVDQCLADRETLKIGVSEVAGARVVDFGQASVGGLNAGSMLARICLADLGTVALRSGDFAGRPTAFLDVSTDFPLEACLMSQYAGWQIAVGDFFAMGSGPLRAVATVEKLFGEFDFTESPEVGVLVLETASDVTADVVDFVTQKSGIPRESLTICVAPTASLAGTIQVIARSVETALHQLHERDFDIRQVVSACGSAPLPGVAKSDLDAIGRTNDAILYGGRAVLWVDTTDAQIESIGPLIPSSASPSHGQPFLSLFEAAGRDFYKLDPALFSVAEIVFHNVRTGRAFHYGECVPDLVSQSTGF